MRPHVHNLGNDCLIRPLDAKYFSQLLEILGAGLANAENSVSEPRHAQVGQLLVEELDTKLGREQWDMLNDGKTDTPLLVLCKVDDSWEKSLGE